MTARRRWGAIGVVVCGLACGEQKEWVPSLLPLVPNTIEMRANNRKDGLRLGVEVVTPLGFHRREWHDQRWDYAGSPRSSTDIHLWFNAGPGDDTPARFEDARYPCGKNAGTGHPYRTAWRQPMPDGFQVLCAVGATPRSVRRFIRIDDALLSCDVTSLDGASPRQLRDAWTICATVKPRWVFEFEYEYYAVGEAPLYRRSLVLTRFDDGWVGWRTVSTLVPLTPAKAMVRYLDLIDRGMAQVPRLAGLWLGEFTMGEITDEEAERLKALNAIYWRELGRAVKGLPPSEE